MKWIQDKSGEFAKKLYGAGHPKTEQVEQAQRYLALAGLDNIDDTQQKAKILSGLGKDESYIEVKKYLNNRLLLRPGQSATASLRYKAMSFTIR